MKICRVTIGYPPRRCGWSHHAHYLSEYQAQRGHAVWVLHLRQQGDESIAGSSGAVSDSPIDLGPMTRFWDRPSMRVLFALRAARRIADLHARNGFDVIHGHGDIFEAAVLKDRARSLGLPLVMTVHSGLNRRARYRWVARHIWPTVDAVVAVSADIAADLQALGVDSSRCTVISSGIRFSQLSPTADELSARSRSSCLMILAVGRLHPMKGFSSLLEAMPSVLHRHPNARLVIVGDGPLREELSRQASTIPQVTLVGEQSHEEVVKQLKQSHVFVLPSVTLARQGEGTPTALIEAMAASLPVVVTTSGGAKEMIRDGENGFVVPEKSPGDLAAQLVRLLDEPRMRESMGARNQELARTRDWQQIATRIEQTYDSVMTRRSGR